jgi:hypothetical protein
MDKLKKAAKILKSVDRNMRIAGISYEELVNETNQLVKIYREKKHREELSTEEVQGNNALVELDN